jgi:arginine decarboxylase
MMRAALPEVQPQCPQIWEVSASEMSQALKIVDESCARGWEAVSNRPAARERVLTGNRIPKDFFLTSGVGQSDITVHAGSYHLALRDAGIEMCNIISYSSILPAIATEVPAPPEHVHGSVMESIMAVATAEAGGRATAGLVWGWLSDRGSGERYGGLVCEYNGDLDEGAATEQLHASLEELYANGYSQRYALVDRRMKLRTLVPGRRYGTALVALCFLNHLWTILADEQGS